MRFFAQLSESVLLINQLQSLHSLPTPEFLKVGFYLPGVELQKTWLLTLGLPLSQCMTQAAKSFLFLLFAPIGWDWSLSSVNPWLLAEGLDLCWQKQIHFVRPCWGFILTMGDVTYKQDFKWEVFVSWGLKSKPYDTHLLFSHSLTRNTCGILGFGLQGRVLPSSEVYREEQTLDRHWWYHSMSIRAGSCFALYCTPSSPTTRLPFIQNWNKKRRNYP